jgi:baculoviral IAP repeat-containing protein 7/8
MNFNLRRHYLSPRAVRITMKSEQDRLNTFGSWTNPHVSPAELASNGFYYTFTSDIVRCSYCFIEVCDFVEADRHRVPKEHKKHSPHCPFILGLPVGNIPIVNQVFELSQNLSIFTNGGPHHKKYVTLQSRLDSMQLSHSTGDSKGITEIVNQYNERATMMSNQGFFKNVNGYQCFYCGLKFFNMFDDKIQFDHANSKCAFVMLNVDVPERDEQNCKICFEKKLDIVFLPCRHLVTCSQCATSVDKCVVCRKTIEILLKIYLSKLKQD